MNMNERILFLNKRMSFRPSYFWIILLFTCIFPNVIHAQSFSPNDDNVFVNPNSGQVSWNVLRNDDLGGNHWSEVTVGIATPPTRAVAGSCSFSANKRLLYQPQPGFSGRDSLRYRIYCPARDETEYAWVFINVMNKPDNIFTDMCTINPPAQVWGVTPKRTTLETLSTYQNALTGDIDGDGIVEIIVAGEIVNSPTLAYKLYIYKGNNLAQTPKTITTVSPFIWQSFTKYTFGKTKIAGKDSTLIVVAENDRFLRAYNYNGALVWKSDLEYSVSNSTSFSPGFADMNNDGIPEIIICGKVYDSRNGKLLCSSGVEGYTIAADLFNTGALNLIVNNRIYKPNAALTSAPHVRTITPVVNTSDPNYPGAITVPTGGFPSAVDIDNDGKLDLIVSYPAGDLYYTFVYIADPSTGVIKGSKYVPNAGASSWPFVGDIDGDGAPEIVFIKNRSSNFGRGNGTSETDGDYQYCQMMAYKYKPGNKILQQFWSYQHYDYSGGTGMTLFDFNLDGIAEIVYRDEWNLRIINGSGKHHQTGLPTGPYNLASFPNHSGTSVEYPTVADVDGDGQAEILMVGAVNNDPGAGGWERTGPLWVFKSADPTNSPWAPARTVWNQYAFNPVFINQDLTIPAYPLNPATEFVTKDGRRHRPYNHFLQQVTDLNDEGEPLFLAPDLAFVFGYPSTTYYRPTMNMLDVGIFITNEGNKPNPSPFNVSVYLVKTDGTYVRVHTESITAVLNPGDKQQIDFSFSFDPSLYPAYKGFEIRLNEQNGAFFFGECIYSNNFSRGKMFTPSERVICEGLTETMNLIPQGVYRYEWYDKDYNLIPYNVPTNNYLLGSQGESFTVTKTNEVVEQFFVLLYDLDNNLMSTNFDTVNIYLAPDTLVWTGEKSKDWHNYGNWIDPKEANPHLPLYPYAKVPRKCTNVLIPDGVDVYPTLSPSETDYSYYIKSECANIHFEHGGEVVRTDSLDYDAAYVHQQLLSNRWYMVSPPLRDFYPGDYYVNDPNPHLDPVYVYTAFFSRTNPETGSYVEGKWTGAFHNPDILLSAGTGMAVWVDDKQPNSNIHTPFDFYFPKYDLTYHVYDWSGNWHHSTSLARGNEHRFVYEPIWNKTTGDIDLPVLSVGSGKKLLVGNPFMAHWDFSEFYTSNMARIKNYYQILDGDGQNFNTYIEYNPSGLSGTGTGITITTANPPLNKYIAPMQSVLIESSTLFSSLKTHVTSTQFRAGEKLRSVSENENGPEVLYIDAEIGGQCNRTAILFDRNDLLGGEYEEGIRKTFLKANLEYLLDDAGNPDKTYPYPVGIYSQSGSGDLLDIAILNDPERTIPLGIATLQTGKIKLSFDTLTLKTFAEEYDIYLIDKGSIVPVITDLRENSSYEFNKTTESLFMDDRLFLSFAKKGTSVGNVEDRQSSIQIFRSDNYIRLFTLNKELIDSYSLTDLQGRTILSESGPGKAEVVITLPRSGFYLLRCSTGKSTSVFKIPERN